MFARYFVRFPSAQKNREKSERVKERVVDCRGGEQNFIITKRGLFSCGLRVFSQSDGREGAASRSPTSSLPERRRVLFLLPLLGVNPRTRSSFASSRRLRHPRGAIVYKRSEGSSLLPFNVVAVVVVVVVVGDISLSVIRREGGTQNNAEVSSPFSPLLSLDQNSFPSAVASPRGLQKTSASRPG